MKSLLKKVLLFLSLGVFCINTVSCSSDENRVYVANDLDLYMQKDDTEVTLSTKEITGDTFLKKINHQESFILYYYSNYCATCTTVSEYWNTFLRSYNYLIYSFSAQASDIYYIANLYPDYFDETPKIMFFKQGELVLTLSSSRYSSYRLFESAMIEFARKSDIYTTTRLDAFMEFISSNSRYYLFLKDDNLSSVNDDDISAYDIYINDIRPNIENNSVPSLVLDVSTISDEIKEYLLSSAFSINVEVYTTTFTYVNNDQMTTYDYLIEDGYNEMMYLISNS